MSTTRISIQQAHRSVRLSAFLLVLSGAVSLILTQRMALPGVILIAAEIVAWRWPHRAGRAGVWEIASFAYLLFFLADLFLFSGALAPALVRLFTFILINKLFNLRAQRDYYQLYLLTFLTILAATSLSAEVEMFYMIAAYIMILLWNITSLTLYSQWRESDEEYFPFSFFSPMYLLSVVGASAVAFLIALGIFFVLPRMQLGFLGGLRQEKVQYVSGFSQKVNLGDINNIQSDPDVAMRVRVTYPKDAPQPLRLYWRGIAFDHYDGKSWSATAPGTRFLFKDSSNTYYAAPHGGEFDSLIRQEFYMEPIDTRVIFGLDRIVRIQGAFSQISRDPNGTLTGMARASMYEVWSRYSPMSASELRRGTQEIPEPIRKYDLQLPFRSARIAGLVQQVAGGAATPIDRVLVLKDYLQRNYEYSTTELPRQVDDPISDFLFVTRSGHCEYFASSMAVLLRYAGVPARVVNGFREGEFNPIGGFYVVRNSDAHSWVEAYVGGQWVPIDPSPMDVAPESSLKSLLSIRRILDSISFFWDRYILIFSGQDQVDALTGIRDQVRSLRDRFGRSEKSQESIVQQIRQFWLRHNRVVAALALSAAFLYLAVRALLRRKRNQLVSRTPVLFYQEMLSILARKGFVRPPQSTPAEFVKSIETQISPDKQPDVLKLTELFYRARFGGYNLTASDQIEVRNSLSRLAG